MSVTKLKMIFFLMYLKHNILIDLISYFSYLFFLKDFQEKKLFMAETVSCRNQNIE